MTRIIDAVKASHKEKLHELQQLYELPNEGYEEDAERKMKKDDSTKICLDTLVKIDRNEMIENKRTGALDGFRQIKKPLGGSLPLTL